MCSTTITLTPSPVAEILRDALGPVCRQPTLDGSPCLDCDFCQRTATEAGLMEYVICQVCGGEKVLDYLVGECDTERLPCHECKGHSRD